MPGNTSRRYPPELKVRAVRMVAETVSYTHLDVYKRQAQDAAARWCTRTAGMRLHGTIHARPLEVFLAQEAPVLLPVTEAYDVPVFTSVKVHRDFHVEVAKALYSVPEQYLGEHLDARADSQLVKLYRRGTLVKTHPRQPPGGRATDRADLPEHKAGYAPVSYTHLDVYKRQA